MNPYISAVSTGYWAFFNFEKGPGHLLPSPAGRRSTPLFPSHRPNLICRFAPPTCSQLGSTPVDPPPHKGQRPLTLFVFFQKTKISAEVLPLSDVNADTDLSRTPRGCTGPPREFPHDLNAPKCIKKQWFFNDFETALNALGELPNVAKGFPMAPQSVREMA